MGQRLRAVANDTGFAMQYRFHTLRPSAIVMMAISLFLLPFSVTHAQRGGRQAAFELLRRMDRNRDGQLTPDEVPADSRAAVGSLANRAGLDSDEAWPLARLESQLRQDPATDEGNSPAGTAELESVGGQSGDAQSSDRPGRGDRSDRRRSARPDGGPDRRGPDEPAPSSRSAGFGSVSAVQGFGNEATSPQSLESRYDARVLQNVDRFLRSYDRNQNGQLDADEWAGVRWGDEPKQSDTNGDGVLSRAELSERMAKRWGIQPRSSASSTASRPSGFGGRSATSSTSSGNSQSRYNSYATQLLKRYDGNQSSVLEKDEWSRMSRTYHAADADKDELITLNELVAYLSNYQRSNSRVSLSTRSTRRAPSFADRRSSREGDSRDRDRRGFRDSRDDRRRRDDEEAGKKSYRFLTPTERLRAVLSGRQRDAFTKLDRDADGQIAMAEFATTWTDEKVQEFDRLDADHDGFVTPQEYAQAN